MRSRVVRVVTAMVLALALPATAVASTGAASGGAEPLPPEQPRARISPVAGGGLGDGGPATDALSEPERRAVVVEPDGTLLVKDRLSEQVRSVDPVTGVVEVRFGATRTGATEAFDLEKDRTWDADDIVVPVGQVMVRGDDGTLWSHSYGSWLASIDPAGRVRGHWLPRHLGYQWDLRVLHVLRDGSVVVAVERGPDGRSGTTGLLRPGWTATTVPERFGSSIPRALVEGPDGVLYESNGIAVHRLDPAGRVLVLGDNPDNKHPEPGQPTDGPAVGAAVSAGGIAVDGRTLAYLDRLGAPYTEIALRVVQDGRIRTVADNADLVDDPASDRTHEGTCPGAGVLLSGDDIIVSCGHAVRAFAVDGSDRGTRGRLLLGRDLEHRFGSPSGTPLSRAGLPAGIHRLVQRPEGLVVLSAVDARQVVQQDGVEVVEVLADVRDAAAGVDLGVTTDRYLSWRADLLPDGRVVAVLCPGRYRPCLLRVQDGQGGWRTLAGGGTSPVVDGVPAPGVGLGFTEPRPMLVHPQRGEVLLPVVRPDPDDDYAGAWVLAAVPVDGGALRVVAAPDPAGPVRSRQDFDAVRTELMPDGRVLLTRGNRGDPFLVDPATGATEVTALPWHTVTGAVAPTADGTIWSSLVPGYSPGVDHRRLSTGEMLRGAWGPEMLAAGARSDGALLVVPGGVLTAGADLPGPVHRVDVSPAPPAAPTGVTAVPGDARAGVTWQEADGVGLSVTRYRVTAQPGGRSVEVAGTARSATVTGLTNGTAHRFTVTATNAAGESEPSTPSAAVTPRDTTPPGPVTRLTSTSGFAGATLRWTPPADPDLAGVTVVRKPGRYAPGSPTDGQVVYSGSAAEATVTGLTQGGLHSVSVFSRDAAGNHGPRAVVGWAVSSVTSTASSASVVWGQPVTHQVEVRGADGSRLAKVPVELHVRKRGGVTWTRVATATTSATGTAALSHKPSWDADYQVRFPGSAAVVGSGGPVRPVDAALSVTGSVDRTTTPRRTFVSISGKVGPNHATRPIHLQRLVGTRWERVAVAQLSAQSTYRFSVRRTSKGTETYRVVAPGDADHRTGATKGFLLRWT